MNDDWYRVLEQRFGPAYPFERMTEYWTVENIGFSDPKRPSWFPCMGGKYPVRFDNEEEAYQWAQQWQRKNSIRCRVVHRQAVENYTYLVLEEVGDELR